MPIYAVVDSIARPEINSVLRSTISNRPRIAEIAAAHPGDSGRDRELRMFVLYAIPPSPEWGTTSRRTIIKYFSLLLPLCMVGSLPL